MPKTLHLQETGKPNRGLLTAASRSSHPSRHFFQHDSISGKNFLIDTGAAHSIIPATTADQQHNRPDMSRFTAANGSAIPAFGDKILTVCFNGKSYRWKFAIAAVNFPIIGYDFLEHFNLVVRTRARQLVRDSAKIAAIASTPPPQLRGFEDLLVPKFDRLSDIHHAVEHHIATKGSPVHARARRLPPDKLAAAKAEFTRLEEMGVIRPSNSPFSSPLHMVKKSDGSWRPCGDFRRLNAATTPDRYPLPHLIDFSTNLNGAVIFSKIDLLKGFYHIPVAADSIPKTAVITPFGLFEFLRMPFGLCNAAQSFQRFMDQVVRGLENVFVYVDDVLVFSRTAAGHDAALKALLERFRQHGITIHAEKCIFGVPSLTFLGHHVSAAGIQPLPERVRAVADFPLPTALEGLQEFLGMLNYYRRFIPRAADTLQPLTAMLKKSAGPFSFTPAAKSAFIAAKKALATATMLTHQVPDAVLGLSVDASAVAVGATLEQWVDDSWQPLGFFSRTLRDPEKKYSAFDRELLAMYLAVRHFRHLLEGRDFVIFTDHKPLTFAMTAATDYSPRQSRHLTFISEFCTNIQHVAGKKNGPADALSRNPLAAVQPPTAVSWEAIATAQAADPSDVAAAKSAMTSLQWTTVNLNSGAKLLVDTTTPQQRPYIPAALRHAVFLAVHGLAHPGARATRSLITQRYVWWGIKKDVTKWTKNCVDCQRAKIHRHTSAPLGQLPTPSGRFQILHVDLVGPLPLSEGFQHVLTVVDRFTRWPEVIPVRDTSAETCARALMTHWIARFGVPRQIVSDRGRQFTSVLWSQLAQLLGVKLSTTTAYHPQCNGMVERFHRQLKDALRARLVASGWVSALPLILLSFRTTPKADIGAAPADLVYGTSLALPAEMLVPPAQSSPPPQDFLQQLRHTMSELRSSPPAHHGRAPVYVPTTLRSAKFVFLRDDTVRPSLSPPYLGPFRVARMDDRTAIIEMNGHEERVSIDRLKPAYTTPPTMDPTPSALATHDYL